MESRKIPLKHHSDRSDDTGREKRLKRKEILEKKKSKDELIKAASSDGYPLAAFPASRHYDGKGLSVCLESGSGDKLSYPVKQYIQNLLKVNMEGQYGSEWPAEEKVKRREMVAPEARYIFIYEALSATSNETSTTFQLERRLSDCVGCRRPLVGFVHYRFTLEEEVPVLYVYEIQLESCIQGKGLGEFLMQLIELIACKKRMGAVVLTVQKANLLAMNFYISKLRYVISSISPSRVNPLTEDEVTYEILCKGFNDEAKAILEESG